MTMEARSAVICSKCGTLNSHVIDSRGFGEGRYIRRRRECRDCGHRYTTYESEKRPAKLDEMARTLKRMASDIRDGLD
jgi:transcriptional regulator NrdR family protein